MPVPEMDPDHDLFERLHTYAYTLHELSLNLTSLRFADERDWLNDEEREEWKSKSARYDVVRQEADAFWTGLEIDHSTAFNRYLTSQLATLTSLLDALRGGGTPLALKHDSAFNRSILEHLIDTFTAIINHEELPYDRWWAIAVCVDMIQQLE